MIPKPKYLNSPETLIFHKSRNLFALNLAKTTKNGYFILAEGYMDVIALHQAGFDLRRGLARHIADRGAGAYHRAPHGSDRDFL